MRPGRIVAIGGALIIVVLLVLFALVNRGQPIALDFGIWAWQGDAIYAIYAGACLGLIAMFAVSLPSDLAIRREHRRLLRREPAAAERPSDPGASERG